MRKLSFALATLVVAFAIHAQQPAAADNFNYPWCATETESGGMNCTFVSLQQCLATINGDIAICGLNPVQPAANAFAMATPTSPAKKPLARR